MVDLVSRVATTGKLLVRSGIEIDRLLSAMVKDHAPVSATLPGQLMFLSRLLDVDPLKQRLVIAYSDYRDANSALLKSSTVVFKVNHRGAKFAFSCRRPRAVSNAGQAGIDMEPPSMVLATQQERVKVNTAIPRAAPDLRCQLPIGVTSLEARLVDMSLDGRAFLLGEPGIPVCAGTSVRGARITPSAAEPVVVDIELKFVIQTALPDGERATRIGCNIVGSVEAMEQLIRRFIIDLE